MGSLTVVKNLSGQRENNPFIIFSTAFLSRTVYKEIMIKKLFFIPKHLKMSYKTYYKMANKITYDIKDLL